MSAKMNVADLFEGFEPIETERLILRTVRESDAEAMFGIMRNPAVIRYFGTPPMASLEEAVARCRKFGASFGEGTNFRLGLQLRETGEFIGSCGFWRFVPEHFRAEISYELAHAHWGRGLMVEALQPILARGFEIGMNSVEANIHPDNLGSRRVLEKLGFQLEGVTRDSFYEPYLGIFTDNAIFGLRKADYLVNLNNKQDLQDG